MSPGGVILVGTTCAVAWLDGGLSALMVGSIVGGGTYWAARRSLATLPAKVLKQQKAALDQKMKLSLPVNASSEEVKEARREAQEAQKKLEACTAEQSWGNKELSAAAGLAAFACPLLGVVALAGFTVPVWSASVAQAGNQLSRIVAPADIQAEHLLNHGLSF